MALPNQSQWLKVGVLTIVVVVGGEHLLFGQDMGYQNWDVLPGGTTAGPSAPPPAAPLVGASGGGGGHASAAPLVSSLPMTVERSPAYQASTPLVSEPLWREATWYSRLDYFHWNERVGGADFVTEDGALVALGYMRRVGRERFRAEMFGGSVNYRGAIQYWDGSQEPLASHTNYLGVRGEYDLLFEPEAMPNTTFFLGVGTRLWVRDLPDAFTTSGELVQGYQETWWTTYPYLGCETRRRRTPGLEPFGSARIGCTAVTFEHATLDDLRLYPKAGLIGQLEGGVRTQNLLLSAFFEAMSWEESATVRYACQPRSVMFTAGMRFGWSF
jgi:hypothetical protein